MPRRICWVWRDRSAALPPGIDAAAVKAADGHDIYGASGYDYSADWRAWAGQPRIPWTWLGPPESADGVVCADVLYAVTGPRPAYIVDVEQGPIPAGAVAAFADRLRTRSPGCQVWFTSYPSAAQAVAHGVPWAECVTACDGGMPQVYWPSQRGRLDEILADHHGRPVHIAVSPGDDPGWLDSAAAGLQHAGVSIWRLGLAGAAGWAADLATLSGGDMLTDDDVERVARRTATVVRDTTGLAKADQLVSMLSELKQVSAASDARAAGTVSSAKAEILGAVTLVHPDLVSLDPDQLDQLAHRIADLDADLTPDEVIDRLATRLSPHTP
jgi:hypothetical protein